MPYLTDVQIGELSDPGLESTTVLLRLGRSVHEYRLVAFVAKGMKGVVWRAKDEIGEDVALKFVPAYDYLERSLIDEVGHARRLRSQHFARVLHHGDAEFVEAKLKHYKGIATEWVPGPSLEEFAASKALTVDEFIQLAEQLYRSLAELNARELVHDDLHPRNILVAETVDELVRDRKLIIKIIDTGTVKRVSTRNQQLEQLTEKVRVLREAKAVEDLHRVEEFLAWKAPGDHLRAVHSLLLLANSARNNYARSGAEDRRFLDFLPDLFDRLVDVDLSARLDEPLRVVEELEALLRASKQGPAGKDQEKLQSPFDYISSEMIRNDHQFAELFSRECPWLDDCMTLEPLYVYGPRGCGKSSVLRWLSFKAVAADAERVHRLQDLREVGIYVSCSVELRSRFWLVQEDVLEKLAAEVVGFFNLLLLEELSDTLLQMGEVEAAGRFEFGLTFPKQRLIAEWLLRRVQPEEPLALRVQGQSYLSFVRDLLRKLKWKAWAQIRRGESGETLVDAMLVTDVCRFLGSEIEYFRSRHVTFLVDDYSNQRIPPKLQRMLNQAVSFAKQGNPLFKVSSEYGGVDLTGIQAGREVVEINVGDRYTSARRGAGEEFLKDIIDLRLQKAGYAGRAETLLGLSRYGQAMADDIAAAARENRRFHYHGLDTIHGLCSGDVALALDLVRRVFESGKVGPTTGTLVAASVQSRAIQAFSSEELQRIRYIAPYGRELEEIVNHLGALARALVVNRRSQRADRDTAMCKTHIDIRMEALRDLEEEGGRALEVYRLLTSRAVLFSLTTSRSRIEGNTERLQMRRIYFPIFLVPVKRDVPIKIDALDELRSLLTDPKSFCERELRRSDFEPNQLELALEESVKVRREATSEDSSN